MSAITLVVLILVALAVVAGLGLLIVRLQRRTQKAVPDLADRQEAHRDRVVGVDEKGREVLESEDAARPERDDGAFEHVLSESLEELHPEGRVDDAEGAAPGGGSGL
jgi:hypothetical protein